MPEPKKKITCLECGKDFDPESDNGVCPDCGLDMGSVLETDRNERALAKLREQRIKGSKKKRTGLW